VKLLLRLYILLILGGGSFYVAAQERVTTFGIQLKPIIPMGFMSTGKQQVNQNNVDFILNPRLGMNFGMVIRKGFTKSLSLETGINFLQRHYSLTVTDLDSNYTGVSSFKLVNYELPVLGLIYVQLGEMLYMNVAGGVSFDIYPSELRTENDYVDNILFRYNWISTSLLANVGWEYRTSKSGYLYLGTSLHRPFGSIFRDFIFYENKTKKEDVAFDLSGNYITLDIRYFFHEDQEKKRKKLKKTVKVKKSSKNLH